MKSQGRAAGGARSGNLEFGLPPSRHIKGNMPKSAILGAVLATTLSLVYSRTVEVDITAPWREFSTSLGVQLAEYVRSLTSNQANPPFWSFLDNLCQHSSVIDAYVRDHNNEELQRQYKGVLANASRPVIPVHMLSLAETMLDMGYYTASVPFFESLSQPYVSICGEDVEVITVTHPEGRVQCGKSGTGIKSGAGIGIHPDFDFVYPHTHTHTGNGGMYSCCLYQFVHVCVSIYMHTFM
ncbi:hypothetical protein EON65_57200 [archaeon]|nr:MAG: hypothetical protein EON65_57200 [archaeon]